MKWLVKGLLVFIVLLLLVGMVRAFLPELSAWLTGKVPGAQQGIVREAGGFADWGYEGITRLFPKGGG